MEVDAGFDMVPPLSKEAEDARNWGKPDEPESHALLPIVAEPAPEVSSNPGLGLFKVEQVPGKGRGIITLSDIARGTCILRESSLILIHNILPAKLNEVSEAKVTA
ncbi:hypothetical protein F4821DRAFT_274540 [Hypoxylon rubiginosum]|uniref:Uncharacterized protein n=1 Tax=Hypoxylon rubiginosum TaxID=110542 RepID=A0ACC0CNI6_9PEZI|nr:hypothetical protein F4821DRAFT_274540 [Hypoxylon rubiginosum]